MASATRRGPPPAGECPAQPKRPGQAVLRELLEGWFGRPEDAGEARPAVVGGRHFLLTPVAKAGGRSVYTCEWPRSPRLPAYRTRRLLHALVGERATVVFSDAAGTRRVWGWARPMPFAATAYTEAHGVLELPADLQFMQREGDVRGAALDGGPGSDVQGAAADRTAVDEIAAAEPAETPGVDDPAAAMAGAEAVRAVLIARLRRDPRAARRLRGGRALPSAVRLQRLVEDTRTPRDCRFVWREATSLRVLDPACGTGSWLLGCLSALVAVGAACLQWMQAWVEDHPGARADRDADFRRLLARARELSAEGVRDRLVAETILLSCLYGVEAHPASAARAVALLSGQLGATGMPAQQPDEAAFADVRVGRLAEPGPAYGHGPAMAALSPVVAGEAEGLGRAWDQIVRVRLRARAPCEVLREGREEIRRRRRALSTAIPRGGNADSGIPVLHPFIEFHEVLREEGFHLVRTPPNDPAAGGDPGGA